MQSLLFLAVLAALVLIMSYSTCNCAQPHWKQSTQPWSGDFSRLVSPSATERMKYVKDDGTETVLHYGQRKLLISEIEFFVKHGVGRKIVVYVGAASGTHILILAQMFPEKKFLLYDSQPFAKCIKKHPNIQLNSHLFTDTTAELLAAEHKPEEMLFISDIRDSNHHTHGPVIAEKRMIDNMHDQLRWFAILDRRYEQWRSLLGSPNMPPEHNYEGNLACMLKFKVPFKKGAFRYLDGDLYLPVWGPVKTSECRLMIGPGMRKGKFWDQEEHTETLAYFNNVKRCAKYPNELAGSHGMDECYDCTAEVHVVKEYMSKIRRVSDIKMVANFVKNTSSFLRRALNAPAIDKDVLQKKIMKKQWGDAPLPGLEGEPAKKRARTDSSDE